MSTPVSVKPAARLPGLDLVRASAIVWVMFYHASLYGLAPADAWIVKFGWMGVDLFFVLSGYLIGGQLLRPFGRAEKPDYPRFAGRRLLRTLPAYFIVLATYAAWPAVRDRPAMDPLWRFLSFTQNLLTDPSTPKALSHAWSLCVEEQFYVLFPVLAALIALRPSRRKVAGAIAAVLVGGMLLRAWLWIGGGMGASIDPETEAGAHVYMRLIYYPTWSRLDGLTLGVAAACLQTFRPSTWHALTRRPNLLTIAGVAGIVASTAFFGDQIAGLAPTVLGFPMLALSITAIVVSAATRGSLLDQVRVPGAQALATIAYSLYLTHKAVFHFIQNAPLDSVAVAFGARPMIALVLSLLVGTALYILVERPFLAIRDRLDGRSRTSLAAAHGAT